MARRLQSEIKQSIPFRSIEIEAFLNLMRTHDALLRGVQALLRGHRLSLPQYNALRILRGAGDQGRTCGEIAERMITRDPDVTRLLDRLEARALVRRERQASDRRVVRAFITPAGIGLLDLLDEPVDALHARQLGHLGEDELAGLIALLEKARERCDGSAG